MGLTDSDTCCKNMGRNVLQSKLVAPGKQGVPEGHFTATTDKVLVPSGEQESTGRSWSMGGGGQGMETFLGGGRAE